MKFLIVFISSIVLAVSAAPSAYVHHPLVYTAAVPTASQWHAQDGLGSYSYGYQGGPSAKSEIKTLDGITQGSYSYVDANSQLQTVNYVSDALGFRVAATNLPTSPVDDGKAPEPVEDTVEVKAAKAEHLAAFEKVKNGENSQVAPLEAPELVEDTVEVKAARDEHLQAVEVAKTRNALAVDDSETIVQPATIAIHGAPIQTIQTYQAHAPLVYHTPYAAPAAYHHHHLSAAPIVLRSQPAFAYSVWNQGAIPNLIAA